VGLAVLEVEVGAVGVGAALAVHVSLCIIILIEMAISHILIDYVFNYHKIRIGMHLYRQTALKIRFHYNLNY